MLLLLTREKASYNSLHMSLSLCIALERNKMSETRRIKGGCFGLSGAIIGAVATLIGSALAGFAALTPDSTVNRWLCQYPTFQDTMLCIDVPNSSISPVFETEEAETIHAVTTTLQPTMPVTTPIPPSPNINSVNNSGNTIINNSNGSIGNINQVGASVNIVNGGVNVLVNSNDNIIQSNVYAPSYNCINCSD